MFFLTSPERFDVVVTDNLFGDILTDIIGAAIAGGIGLSASGNLDVTAANPEYVLSLCTVRHPTSPGRARPIRRRRSWSVAMMLDHLGEQEAAIAVEKAASRTWTTRGDAVRSTPAIGDDLVGRLGDDDVHRSVQGRRGLG